MKEHRAPIEYMKERRAPIEYMKEHRAPIVYMKEHRAPIVYMKEHRAPIVYMKEHRAPVEYMKIADDSLQLWPIWTEVFGCLVRVRIILLMLIKYVNTYCIHLVRSIQTLLLITSYVKLW